MSAYSNLVLSTPGLASYWRLGESAGPTATAAFGAINGTYSGGASVLYAQPGLLAGDPAATSVLFDDAFPGVCDFGDVYGFENTASYSAEIWCKPDGIEAGGYIWSKGREADGGWLMHNTDPVLVTRRIDSGGADDGAFIASGVSVASHHIVITYNGSVLSLYYDGALVDDVASTRNLPNNAFNLRIGCDSGGGSGFGGWVQDAAIYTTALSPGTILQHYTIGTRGADQIQVARAVYGGWAW